LDGIVTLVDSKHVWQHIGDSDECREQIAFADTIVINKADLSTEEELQRLESRLRSMNRLARVHRTFQAELPIDRVLMLHAFELGQKLEVDPDFLKPEMPFEWSGVYELTAGSYDFVFQSGPDPVMGLVMVAIPDMQSDTLAKVEDRAVSLFNGADQTVRRGGEIHPKEVLQKLVFDEDTTRYRVVVARQGYYAFFTQHKPEEFDAVLLGGAVAQSPVLSKTFSAGHTHDDTVTSVGICCPGQLDLNRLNAWFGETLRTRGADIFRMKGILNIKGSPNRFVFQGVHMLFDGKPDRPWLANEDRSNQLVFIGRNLNREALNAGFRRCLVA